MLRTSRFMRLSCSVSSGSADSMTSPGNCRTKSLIGLRTKLCWGAAGRSTSALAVWKLIACAQSRYFPAGSGGKWYSPLASVKTVVVTVPPTGFADTVTPPSFSPAAEVIVPLRMASPAFAPAARLITAPMMAISVASRIPCARVMTLPPVGLIRSARRACRSGRNGYGFQVRNDRFDWCGLDMIFEARHAGGAIADDLPHHRFLSARRILRQFGTVERARHLRLGVADAARLIEQPHAHKLLVVEGSAACLLRRRALRRQRERDHPGTQSDCQPPHRASSRHRRPFLAAFDRPRRQGSASCR